MAACGSLHHIFEKPLPENPSLIESLSSWNQIKSMKTPSLSSFTEIFGELHFKENSDSSSSSSSSPSFSPFSSSDSSSSSLSTFNDSNVHKNEIKKNTSMNSLLGIEKNQYSDGFQSKNLESLQLCTEGLGFESSDDVEVTKDDWESYEKKERSITRHSSFDNLFFEIRKSKMNGGFPPPISSIGRSGKPWFCFKSYRHDGRFVLKEMKIPTKEFLHAFREDGRLKLHFVQPDDEIPEDEQEEEEEEEEEETQDEEPEEDEKKEDDAEEGIS